MGDKSMVFKMDAKYHDMLDQMCDREDRTRKAIVQRMIEEKHRQDFGDTSETPQDVEGSA